MMYLLDANVLIRAHEDYYPIDRVPQYWIWLLQQAEKGIIKMPFEIHGEIAIATGPLKDWICDKAVKEALILDEAADPAFVQEVTDKGYGANLTDSDLYKVGRDPILVSYAYKNPKRVIVTKEVSKPGKQGANRKIPDVCKDLQVPWTRDFELYKILNFKTT
ncbi:MAG: DUF4411 family protein [Alphaproteobacteria bacterium]|nr:DUF4411 family protein [Alphaproteobacteria bacterium]